MLDKLYPEIDRFSELACLHVALLATSLQTCHKGILKKCSQKLVEDMSNARLKDIERILNVLTMFTYDPQTKPDIFQKAFEELHKDSRIGEFNQHPRCLPAALNYLSLRGLYSYELMNRVLDYDFIINNFGKFPKLLPRQLFCLDCAIDVECPDYKGNRLRPEIRYKAAKWQTEWPPSHDQWKKISPKDQFFLDALDSVKKVVGHDTTDFVSVRHVVPHFPMADIIVCKDLNTNKFTKLLGFERYIHGDVMFPHQDGTLKWYAILILTRNNTTRGLKNELPEPLGTLAMKIRHLEKIGYNPVQVVWRNFLDLNFEDKVEYIRNKLR
ncbi:FAST kinase domain-containing protein 5, mitochondrial isoform X2 [Anthonomus grandis grandis]|nr:FAST kinase domain-containing protein 5, mitochondrial isoform X2 [Anthonomus grandis grandis]